MPSYVRLPARFDPRRVDAAGFLRLIEAVPWMSRLGRAHRCDDQVLRIRDWDDTPHPQTRGVMSLLSEHSEWRYDRLGDRFAGKVAAYWDRVMLRALNLAAVQVPYSDESDPDYPPNSAAGYAGWVAGSIGICIAAGAAIPGNALRQWAWYVRGHWPCAYEDGVESPAYQVAGIPRSSARLVVF
jgi:hypothetical protein